MRQSGSSDRFMNLGAALKFSGHLLKTAVNGSLHHLAAVRIVTQVVSRGRIWHDHAEWTITTTLFVSKKVSCRPPARIYCFKYIMWLIVNLGVQMPLTKLVIKNVYCMLLLVTNLARSLARFLRYLWLGQLPFQVKCRVRSHFRNFAYLSDS